MPEPEADPPAPSVWKQRWSRFVRHPASLLVWFTLLSVVVREQYPVSHFPMYSGFESETWYIYFETADGNPIQTKRAFRNTVARCKKRYSSLRDDYADEIEKDTGALTEADHEIIGGRLLEELKRKAPDKVKAKPDLDSVFNGEVTLVRVDIRYTGGEFTTEEHDVATR